MATSREELNDALRETIEHLGSWRDDSRLAHRYAASDQWNQADKRQLQKDMRPALTVNLLHRLYGIVSGNEITNRFEGKYLPRTLESEQTAEQTTGIVKAMRQSAHAEFEETSAFRDLTICGVGCVEYHENERGDLQLSRVPYSEIAWDPGARKMCYDDAEWVLRGRWIPARKFKEMFPDADIAKSEISEAYTGQPFGGPPNQGGGGDSSIVYSPFLSATPRTQYDPRRRLVLTYELQKKSHETYLLMTDPETGEQMEIDEEDYPSIAEVYVKSGRNPPQAEKKTRAMIERSWWAGAEKIEEESIENLLPSYLFMTGYEDMRESTVLHRGLHHHLREAQDVVNKAISKMLHILQTAPNNLLLTETGVFDNPKAAQKTISTTGGIIEMTLGAVQGKRYEFVEGRYPQNFERLFSMFSQFFSEISGINMLAASEAKELTRVASSAITQVQQQAMTVMSVLYDSLRKYRILSGYWFLDYIRNEVPDGRIFNILNAFGSSDQIIFNKEAIAAGQFDVVVTEAPSTPSQMVEFWDTITRSGGLDLLMQSGTFTQLEVAKIVPHIPADIRQEIIQRITQQMASPQEMPPEAPEQMPIQ